MNSETSCKLLSWQIKREETDKLRHSDVKDDGRSLFYSQDINHDFPIFYRSLCQSDKDVENTKATTLLNSLILPKLDPNKRECLDVNMSENALMQHNKTPGPDGFPLEYFKSFSEKLLIYQASMLKEDLTKKTLPSSLELKTLTLLPKPRKDLVSPTASLAF